jgi:ubiquinone/menaquinone biosynthesis C-methylase UbiE
MLKTNNVNNYYINNKVYSDFLNNQEINSFSLYIDSIIKYSNQSSKILDVGCGSGIVVDHLSNLGLNCYGIEISDSSLQICKLKKGKYCIYNGNKIPFKDFSFNIVGTWNVLEHVDNVNNMLYEMKRVLKQSGVLIIGAPNLLSITNSYHYRTRGIIRKITNVLILMKKTWKYFTNNRVKFDKFNPVHNEPILPDDDAVNLKNPIDIVKWSRQNNFKVLTNLGNLYSNNGILGYIRNIFPLRYLSGGVFVIMQKL